MFLFFPNFVFSNGDLEDNENDNDNLEEDDINDDDNEEDLGIMRHIIIIQ